MNQLSLVVQTVLVVCLETSEGKSLNPVHFYFNLEYVKNGVNAKSIYNCLPVKICFFGCSI
jgi:hypothetical protein